MFGAIATGVFASAAIQEAYTGLLEGNVQQLLNQFVAVGATIAYASISTFVIVKVVDLILGIRVSARDEEIGIDLATHGEVAYQT
jgi:Amt family ammonium transporter